MNRCIKKSTHYHCLLLVCVLLGVAEKYKYNNYFHLAILCLDFTADNVMDVSKNGSLVVSVNNRSRIPLRIFNIILNEKLSTLSRRIELPGE